jgi:hypothetical protein
MNKQNKQNQQVKRPPTMHEMQVEKQKKDKGPELIIENISKQLIPIHQRQPKGVDFYFGAQDIRLGPGQRYKFDKRRLFTSQVERLQKQRKIQVIYDEEKQPK